MVPLCKYTKNQRHTQILQPISSDLSNLFPSIYIPGCQNLFPPKLYCLKIQFPVNTDKHFRTDHSPKSPDNSFFPAVRYQEYQDGKFLYILNVQNTASAFP